MLRAKPFEVLTSTAVVVVRGNQYRDNPDEDTSGRTLAEVIEGAVRLHAGAAAVHADVPMGLGAVIDASAAPPKVARLLGALYRSTLPERFERAVVRFELDEAAPLRAQVAADSEFDKTVSEQGRCRRRGAHRRSRRRAVVLARSVHRRARHEGLDASRPLVFRARPEQPACLTPRANARRAVGAVGFASALNARAPRACLQVTLDAAFRRLVRDRDNIDEASQRAGIAERGSS